MQNSVDDWKDVELNSGVARTTDYLSFNEGLNERVYQIILNFEWIFVTMQLLAPPVEDVIFISFLLERGEPKGHAVILIVCEKYT